jgi:hypothetical protein
MHTTYDRIRGMSTIALEVRLTVDDYCDADDLGIACLIELLTREGMPSVYAHHIAVREWPMVANGLIHWRELL